ncbi:MAG: DUF3810 domain-containing protein [Planctomycetota bacterium]|nr:DUF3810 domain-containing protein [Planctomycetota bacterium]
MYPRIRSALSFLSGMSPTSLAETLTIGALALLLGWMVFGLLGVARGRLKLWRAFAGGVLRGLRLAAAGYLFFALAWGANHARMPLGDIVGWSPVEDKGPVLESLARSLVAALEADQHVSRKLEGFAVYNSDGEVDGRIREALQGLPDTMPFLEGEVPTLRPLRFWHTFANLGISGIFIPMTGEPHFNVGVPACRHPFVAFHEIAHQRGFAREDEANFLGWLLCSRSGDAHYRYAGNLAALSYVMSALSRHDRELASQLRESIPEVATADNRAVRAFWKSFESPVRQISLKVNDTYLKSQGQSHGVRSYGRMVELMLAYHSQTR